MANAVALSATYQDADNMLRFRGTDELVPDATEVIDTEARKVACITCPTRLHPANMVNVYDGEYQCQECRWGL